MLFVVLLVLAQWLLISVAAKMFLFIAEQMVKTNEYMTQHRHSI